MKNITSLIFAFLVVSIFISCSKGVKNTTVYTSADYMIIGHQGGFVAYISPYYKITGSQLLEDTTHYSGSYPVPSDTSGFNFSQLLPSARFDSVSSILASIPAELFNRNNADIGDFCPDFGYDDIRASVNGVFYKWSFECDQSKSSSAVQQFVKQIRADF
jgi:hypothetical protein